jgi:adenine-specific DNA-methyltransferase
VPTLEWIGKDKVINHHQDVPYRVLERKYTYTDGAKGEKQTDGNKIIRGDNLVALKSLLPQYEGKIKCIYIDPPYNTGNEGWVYNDNVNDSKIKKWLNQVVGKEGEDLSRHDKWLCMMYPRLKLLQKLLSDDGAIFISIDDNEVANLKLVCDEIFGARNYIANFIWRKVDSPNDNKVPITPDHEYIIAYAQNKERVNFSQMSAPGIVEAYGQTDENGRRYRDRLLKKNGRNSMRRDRPTMYFPLTAPNGKEVYPTHDNGEEARWAMSKEGVARHQENATLIWKERQRQGVNVWEPYTREFAPDDPRRPFPSIWYDLPTMRQAKAFLRQVFNSTDLFDTPKPSKLIERILQLFNDTDFIALDSFAGSGTTAHAVLNLNKQDGGSRKFILVEMEDYAETITAERVRRVIDGCADVEGTGGSFSFYELGEPLILDDGNLNENIPVERIREYVFYMEAKRPLTADKTDNPYYLGKKDNTDYYFYYERDRITTLDRTFLGTLSNRSEGYVVYADKCKISPEDLKKYGVVFKKIPRDITRL